MRTLFNRSRRRVERPRAHREAGATRPSGRTPRPTDVLPPGTDFETRGAVDGRGRNGSARRTRPRIVVAGDICVDYYAAHNRLFPGGQAFNFAVHAAQLGARVALAGCAGTDFWGNWLLDRAALAGVDTSLFELREGQSFVTTVEHSGDGERRFVLEAEGATKGWEVADAVLARARDADLLYVTPWARAGVRLARARSIDGALIACDCSSLDVESTPPADVAFADIVFATGDGAQAIVGAGVPLVVVTRGASGSAVFGRAGLVSELPGANGEVVDTLGAGDGLAAAFCMAYLAHGDVRAAHEAAVARAAEVCAHMGGTLGPTGEWDKPRTRKRVPPRRYSMAGGRQ